MTHDRVSVKEELLHVLRGEHEKRHDMQAHANGYGFASNSMQRKTFQACRTVPNARLLFHNMWNPLLSCAKILYGPIENVSRPEPIGPKLFILGEPVLKTDPNLQSVPLVPHSMNNLRFNTQCFQFFL